MPANRKSEPDPSLECPYCRYPNSYASATCAVCHEPLPRGRREAMSLLGIQDPPKFALRNPADLPPVQVGRLRSLLRRLQAFWKKRHLIQKIALSIVAAALLATAGWGVHVVRRHAWQMALGRSFAYRFFPYSNYRYLVRFQNDIEMWTMRNNQLDLRYDTAHIDETGVLTLSTMYKTARRQTMQIDPSDWIGRTPVTTEDPSLQPGLIILDQDGVVVSRDSEKAARCGKTLPFLMPAFPKGSHPLGDSWTESIHWTDDLGPWKIEWQAVLHWTFKGHQPGADGPVDQLGYVAELTPRLARVPSWARELVTSTHFLGEAAGTALFDPRLNQLVLNSFAYNGKLWIALSDVGRAPAYREQRGGRLHQAGSIVLQLRNSLDVTRP
jgi:hypothetical protein